MARYAAKHRAAPVRTPWHRHQATWLAGGLATVAVGGVAQAATTAQGALAATGSVAVGRSLQPFPAPTARAAAAPVDPTAPVAAVIAGRSLDTQRVSRSQARPKPAERPAAKSAATRKERPQPARAAKHAAPAMVHAPTKPAPAPVPVGDPHAIAAAMLPSYGWSGAQMGCLDALWNRESGWNIYATNPSSGAFGIPQSLPGSKMASAGADWRTNPATQIRWGLGYIAASYGSPCGAWGHSQATGWY